ncbi:MAG: MerR family transcriptional regulator [Piscirickettsiaceae bacterium]|nr:MerR family transcriptional regulator [Piscirickettsiaceae bacterium]
MLTVGELSKKVNVTADTIRHYVRIGLLTPARDPDNGYKLFGQEDVKKTVFIRRAKLLGFTLHDIQIILNHRDKGQSPCPLVRDIIQQRLTESKERLSELNAMHYRMVQAMDKWQSMPDSTPNGDAICQLIEAIDEGK